MPLTYSNIEILNDVYDAANHQLRTNASGGGGGGGNSTVVSPLGRQVDASSISTALSTEDVAIFNSILAKIISTPATEAKQDLLIARFVAASGGWDSRAKPSTTDVGAWLVGYNGASGDLVRVQSIRKDLSAVTITSIATVWTPASGKKFRLMGGSISVSAACSVLFEDNSASAGNFVWRTPKLSADTPYNFDLGNGKLSAAVDQVLKATSSAAATITGTLYGVEE